MGTKREFFRVNFERSFIPARYLWSSPFVRWQGSLADVSSNELAVAVTAAALAQRKFDISALTTLIVGQTVPQPDSFYVAPYIAARLGAVGVSGPVIAQACATSVACVAAAAGIVEVTHDEMALVVATDRISNGPLLVYPTTSGIGGTPQVAKWVLDSFAADPGTGLSMTATAEYVAADGRFSREAIDDMTMLRYEQYQRGMADDRAFQRRYMQPIVLTGKRGANREIAADEGIHSYARAALAALKPAEANGVVTFGSQTHPADGCAGAVVCSFDRARQLAGGEGVVRLVSISFARAEKARMPKAATMAAQRAVAEAGLQFGDLKAVTTHNPFAVNDLWFCHQTGYAQEKMNAYGCSLIFGHPQGPTGLRSIAELVQVLHMQGGGYGLFTGCAAGDTGAALIVHVDD